MRLDNEKRRKSEFEYSDPRAGVGRYFELIQQGTPGAKEKMILTFHAKDVQTLKSLEEKKRKSKKNKEMQREIEARCMLWEILRHGKDSNQYPRNNKMKMDFSLGIEVRGVISGCEFRELDMDSPGMQYDLFEINDDTNETPRIAQNRYNNG